MQSPEDCISHCQRVQRSVGEFGDAFLAAICHHWDMIVPQERSRVCMESQEGLWTQMCLKAGPGAAQQLSLYEGGAGLRKASRKRTPGARSSECPWKSTRPRRFSCRFIESQALVAPSGAAQVQKISSNCVLLGLQSWDKQLDTVTHGACHTEAFCEIAAALRPSRKTLFLSQTASQGTLETAAA